jgi:dTDP-4-dehydrorhamnose 3,5-epimerase-like enzyme
MKKKLKDNFKDKRGRIVDIFTNQPKDHCTLVTFNKKAIRGNHFHKRSTQYDFIISGKLKMMTAKVDKKGKIVGKVKKEIISQNMLIEHKPYYAHAFKALKQSKMLALVNGTRGGKDYEKDTFRLKDKLIT